MSIVGCRFRPDQGHHVMVAMSVRRPELGAVHQISVAHAVSGSAHRGKIGTGIWFAHTDGEITLTPGDPRQIGSFLLLTAVAQQQRTALPVRYPVRTDRGTCRQQLFSNHIAFKKTSSSTAIF